MKMATYKGNRKFKKEGQGTRDYEHRNGFQHEKERQSFKGYLGDVKSGNNYEVMDFGKKNRGWCSERICGCRANVEILEVPSMRISNGQ